MKRGVWKCLPACLALVASLAAAARAQESAFQDAKGETSIFLNDGGGFGRINATDKSIELGFTRDTQREKPYFGVDVKGKASGDFASLFNGGTPSPEAEVGFTVGKRYITMKSLAATKKECERTTAADLLKNGMQKLLDEAKEDFLKRMTKKHLDELTKAEGGKHQGPGSLHAAIRDELIRAAEQKGLSHAVATDIAETTTPKLVENELARQAKSMAEADAASPAGSREIRDNAVNGVGGLASQLCAKSPAVLNARALDWLNFRVAYKRARYKLLNTAGAFADQVRKQNFDGYSATLAYNRLMSLDNLEARERPDGTKGFFIVGVSIGVARRNNADDLDSVELEDESFTSASGTTQRRAVSKQTVLSGEYKQFTAVPLNTDVVWYPGALNSRFAVDFFTRSTLGSTDRKFVPGVGLFLTQEKSPTKVVGGISFSVDDGKGKVGLVGGFHF
ncbi:MAG TPA: hypothetical protein VF521_20050 [Pyrinomonadaceae bacterium]